MEILFFGSLVDITSEPRLVVDHFENTDLLKDHLTKKFPALVKASYFIAVNRQMIEGNVPLTKEDSIALMPPFSGG